MRHVKEANSKASIASKPALRARTQYSGLHVPTRSSVAQRHVVSGVPRVQAERRSEGEWPHAEPRARERKGA